MESPNTDAWQRLSANLSRTDWSRFQSYAKRVRSLSYDSDNLYRDESGPPLPPNAMAMLCLHHPDGLPLLPHLETLEWSSDGSPTSIVSFLSSQVKALEVEIVSDSLTVNNFLYAAARKSPNLESFTLKTDKSSIDVEDALRKAIGTWTALQSLTLPRYYLRPSILEDVASLPNLMYLQHTYWHDPQYDEAAVLRDLPRNPFPKLESFSFNGDPASTCRLIQSHTEFFARLSGLHLTAPYGAGDADIQKFFHHLGKTCPDLLCVKLDLWLTREFRKEDVSPLPLEILESLFPCRGLEVLAIGHPFPVTINETDVERMATAWPSLSIFAVGYEFDSSLPIPGNMGHSLSILSAFAKHFPRMQVLGLFFASEKFVGFQGDLYPEHEFLNLEKLIVGVSAVPGGKLHDAAFLIASLCIQKPIIRAGQSEWYSGEEHPKWPDHRRQWGETEQLLEFAMRTKISGRAKMLKTVD
ncbi:hypothetical protein FS837_006874 [Tulasnella sp. UAMH 9824]|nr:hypothetical protein FS837_006874 [Tulasnella sp. UAMH 9824]